MRIVARSDYCLGCRLCEMACAAAHDGYKGSILFAYKRGRPLPRSRVIGRKGNTRLNPCAQCPEAPCIDGCIAGAMHRDDWGAVVVDEGKCVGCCTCVILCPLGHVRFDEVGEKILKCDLCQENGHEPACVAACPNRALALIKGEEVAT